jgi:hypothetical protein
VISRAKQKKQTKNKSAHTHTGCVGYRWTWREPGTGGSTLVEPKVNRTALSFCLLDAYEPLIITVNSYVDSYYASLRDCCYLWLIGIKQTEGLCRSIYLWLYQSWSSGAWLPPSSPVTHTPCVCVCRFGFGLLFICSCLFRFALPALLSQLISSISYTN